jgi:fibronectin-binding autotransporter adhesin
LSGSRPIAVAGSVSGGGALVKAGTNTVTLAGTNIYTGNTTINAGKLALTGSGSIATTPMITIATNATFDVSGVSASPYVNPGGRTLAFNIDKTGGNRTQGQLALGGVNLTYGGSLTVTKTGTDTLTNGDSFTLVTTTNGSTFSGWFSSVSLPALASGLAWNTNSLATNGVLSVVNSTATNPTNITARVSGITLTLTWPADHLGWILQSQTNNLSVGLTTNWMDMAGSGASNTNVITIIPANPTAFFRLRSP